MKFEFSAGGIVYKKDGGIKILVAQHSQHHGWVFPKGLIGDNPSANSGQEKETKEQAAIREVKEETGIEAEIEKELTPVEYWYVWEGEKKKKTVYYYIMKFIGGDTSKHDHEMEEVEWIDYNDVLKRLTYESDKGVWEEAKKLIASG